MSVCGIIKEMQVNVKRSGHPESELESLIDLNTCCRYFQQTPKNPIQ